MYTCLQQTALAASSDCRGRVCVSTCAVQLCRLCMEAASGNIVALELIDQRRPAAATENGERPVTPRKLAGPSPQSLPPEEQAGSCAERFLHRVHERSVEVVRKLLDAEESFAALPRNVQLDDARVPSLYGVRYPNGGTGAAESTGFRHVRHSEVAKDILQARLSKLLMIGEYGGQPENQDTTEFSDEKSHQRPEKRARGAPEAASAPTHENYTLKTPQLESRGTRRSQRRGWLLDHLLRRRSNRYP
jgi:hypothetical protein